MIIVVNYYITRHPNTHNTNNDNADDDDNDNDSNNADNNIYDDNADNANDINNDNDDKHNNDPNMMEVSDKENKGYRFMAIGKLNLSSFVYHVLYVFRYV